MDDASRILPSYPGKGASGGVFSLYRATLEGVALSISLPAGSADVSIDPTNREECFEPLLRVSSAWIRDGIPVFYKPLYWRTDPATGTERLIKGGWRLCPECREHPPSGCGCKALLCHGEHRATLDLETAARMLAAALRQASASTSVAVAVRIPEGVLALDIDRHPGKPDPLESDTLLRLNALGLFDPAPGRTARTIGGGFHYWYRTGTKRRLSLSATLCESVEVKAAGSTLTVAGTEPRGRSYDTDLSAPIPDIDPRLLAYLEQRAHLEQAKAPTAEHRFRQPGSTRGKSANGTADPSALVLDRLERLGRKHRPNGSRQWLAQCPAHPDRNPSLGVKAADDRALLHCYAGCDLEQVLAALDLRPSDLFLAS